MVAVLVVQVVVAFTCLVLRGEVGALPPLENHALISYNYPQHSVGVSDFVQPETYIVSGDPQQFEIVNGLEPCNPGDDCISFHSKQKPNHYLRHRNSLMWLEEYDSSSLFKKDATFIRLPSLINSGYRRYRSVNYPNHYIRHQGYRLKLSLSSTSLLYKKDVSFLEARIGPPVALRSYNYPLYYIGTRSIHFRPELSIEKGRPAHFRMISPGLHGVPGSISFLSLDFMGTFARHSGYVMYLDNAIDNNLYRRDASFKPLANHFYNGYYAFQSDNYPTYFIRHQNYRMRISPSSTSTLYKQDASFHIVTATVH